MSGLFKYACPHARNSPKSHSNVSLPVSGVASILKTKLPGIPLFVRFTRFRISGVKEPGSRRAQLLFRKAACTYVRNKKQYYQNAIDANWFTKQQGFSQLCKQTLLVSITHCCYSDISIPSWGLFTKLFAELWNSWHWRTGFQTKNQYKFTNVLKITYRCEQNGSRCNPRTIVGRPVVHLEPYH